MSETNGENPENPYGKANDPDPYGGAPQSNPYGSAPPPTPYSPPPTNPYGAPQYNPTSVPGYGAGPQYAGPGYPGDPAKTDGMSIGALVASILGFCTCIGFIVGIVLGIIGLGRTKDGRARGRGMAISAIVIGAIGIVLGIIGVVVLVLVGVNQIVTPGNAKVGQCVNVSHDGNNVSMTKESCTDRHDGEIIATAIVDSDNISEATTTAFCAQIVSPSDRLALADHTDLKVHLVTEDPDNMKIGDHIACYVEGTSKLTEDVLN